MFPNEIQFLSFLDPAISGYVCLCVAILMFCFIFVCHLFLSCFVVHKIVVQIVISILVYQSLFTKNTHFSLLSQTENYFKSVFLSFFLFFVITRQIPKYVLFSLHTAPNWIFKHFFSFVRSLIGKWKMKWFRLRKNLKKKKKITIN